MIKLLRHLFSRKTSKKAEATRKPAFVNKWGDGNTFEMPETSRIKGRIEVSSGAGNRLRIGPDSVYSGKITVIGNGNSILLGGNVNYRGDILVAGDGQTVAIGDFTTAVQAYIFCSEDTNVTIGHSCMLSRSIEIRTTDAHSVVECASGARLNPAADIVIGNHVWIGLSSIINKGAHIPSDSIVGAMSFVNGSFEEEGTIIAGTPARVVRRGVTWHRGRKAHYSPEALDNWRKRQGS